MVSSRLNENLALLDFQRLLEREAKRGLCRKNNVFVASERGPAGSSTAARQGADSCAFASAGQAANQCTNRSPATGQHGRTLAFAFRGLSDRSGFYGTVSAAKIDRGQLQGQACASSETAEGFGVNHSASDGRACRNCSPAANYDSVGRSPRKALASLAYLGADSLAQAHGNGCACGYDDRFRLRCGLHRWGRRLGGFCLRWRRGCRSRIRGAGVGCLVWLLAASEKDKQ